MKANLTLLTALLLAPLSALILHAEDAPTPARNGPAQLFPSFRWDRVPVNIHFGKRSEMTDDEIAFVASHSELVTLEKSHGVEAHGSTEKGTAATAARLKQRNQRVKVLFYFNAFVNWPGYEAFKTYRSEWTLRAPTAKSQSIPPAPRVLILPMPNSASGGPKPWCRP